MFNTSFFLTSVSDSSRFPLLNTQPFTDLTSSVYCSTKTYLIFDYFSQIWLHLKLCFPHPHFIRCWCWVFDCSSHMLESSVSSSAFVFCVNRTGVSCVCFWRKRNISQYLFYTQEVAFSSYLLQDLYKFT